MFNVIYERRGYICYYIKEVCVFSVLQRRCGCRIDVGGGVDVYSYRGVVCVYCYMEEEWVFIFYRGGVSVYQYMEEEWVFIGFIL